MRKLFGAIIALLSTSVFATTYTPIALLSPAGSTSGQLIASTGPTSAPVWTTVTLSGLGGLAKANNLSDVASAATARTNLGLGTAAVVNTGTSGATIPLLSTANTWTLGQAFTVRPTFNGATPYDSGNLTIANYGVLANPLSQFAATTSSQLASVLSDETGTGSAVFGTSPTITTPNIVGVTNGAVVATGSVGEYPTPGTAAAVSLASNSPANCATDTLAAGIWDIQGTIIYAPAGTTVTIYTIAAINSTSATLPSGNTGAQNQMPGSATAGVANIMSTPVVRVTLSASTPVYLVGYANFSTSTMSCSGFIRATRVH